jgi:hypothetical protein
VSFTEKCLLSALGGLEPSGSKLMKLNTTYVKSHLPYHVAFQIHVDYSKYTIKHAVVDECTYTCDVPGLLESYSSLIIGGQQNMITGFRYHK